VTVPKVAVQYQNGMYIGLFKCDLCDASASQATQLFHSRRPTPVLCQHYSPLIDIMLIQQITFGQRVQVSLCSDALKVHTQTLLYPYVQVDLKGMPVCLDILNQIRPLT
jgi:hypothetical protein